ncbi:unnamed protein product [Brassicogethes aeneus]|uniref:Uncharacterized protein n=1 Tax=Brassicogethes aeneus TaxID=1431903 RepID=A0A9P0BLP8_BRAAE|nr:unnamed protein product [Brassicogethes aeneus]
MEVNKNNKITKSALGSLLAANSTKIPNLVPPVLHEVGKLAAGVAAVSTAKGSATVASRRFCQRDDAFGWHSRDADVYYHAFRIPTSRNNYAKFGFDIFTADKMLTLVELFELF